MPRGIPSKPTELCPFCGELFFTGVERGDHIVGKHGAECSALLADYDAGLFRVRLANRAAQDDRKLHETLREGIG